MSVLQRVRLGEHSRVEVQEVYGRDHAEQVITAALADYASEFRHAGYPQGGDL